MPLANNESEAEPHQITIINESSENQSSLVLGNMDPYMPIYAVDISHKHSRRECNDQCLHVPMIYQIRKEFEKGQRQHQQEKPPSKEKRNPLKTCNSNSSLGRMSSPRGQPVEYTFNEELNMPSAKSRPQQNFYLAQFP